MTELSVEQDAVIGAAREWAALAAGSSKGFTEGERRSQELLAAVKALDAAMRPMLEDVLEQAANEWDGLDPIVEDMYVFMAQRLRDAGLVKDDA